MHTNKLNQQAISKKLAHLPLGWIEFHTTIGSTNDRAAELALKKVPDFSVVIADEQTKGRGRSGRSWFTPPGTALAFSVVLKPKSNLMNSSVALLSGLGAIAVAEGIRTTIGLEAMIKWPNDVLIEGKKVSGILAEAHWIGDKLEALVLGIGINISENSFPDPKELNFPADSLAEISGKEIDRLIILESVLQEIINLYQILGKPSFIKKWNSLLEFRGKKVQLISGKEIAVIGEIVGLAEDGSLILRTDDQQEVHFKFGEIQMRPMNDS